MAGRRYDVTIVAPGAREIRVRQENHGGDAFIKSALGQRLTFKTKGRQKNRDVNVARIKIRVFWKTEEGGGDQWIGPRNVGSDQTINLQSPVARGDVAPPSQQPSQPSQPSQPTYPTTQQSPGTAWMPNPTQPGIVPSYDPTSSYADTTQYAPEQGGYQTQPPQPQSSGSWWGWGFAGIGTLLAAATGVVIVKKRRAA